MAGDSQIGNSAMFGGVGIALDDSDESQRTGSEGQGPDRSAEIAARVARLSAGQIDCLRLVDQLLSSKEIATELKISPHTVDQRIRQALHTLGVERRAQAARLVAQFSGPYQRLIHQTPYIEAEPGGGHPDAA